MLQESSVALPRVSVKHGLESTINQNKREILEEYGEVIAPILDYKNNSNIYNLLSNQIIDEKIDIIIGSSLGGFMGYYLSENFNKPSLLFNPALPYRSVNQIINEKINPEKEVFKYIVLGRLDNIVKFEDNLDFLIKNTINYTSLEIKIINNLEHRIPLEIFKKEIRHFFISI